MAISEPPGPRASRRRRQLRRRALIVGGALVLVAGLAGATAWLLSSDTRATAGAPTIAPTTTVTTAPPTPAGSVVATTKVPALNVYSQPNAGAALVTTLSAATDYGLPRTLLVTEQQPGWLHTLLPIRPNGSSGWVRDTDVTLTTTTLRIEINLTNRYLVLYDGTQKILDTAVGIGTDQTPTPVGIFYVTDPVDLTARPNGAYGAYALGLSGFSEVLKSFEGGPGQIAVHGDAVAADGGQKVSNGCIRVPNDVILLIAKLVPLGTPVVITG